MLRVLSYMQIFLYYAILLLSKDSTQMCMSFQTEKYLLPISCWINTRDYQNLVIIQSFLPEVFSHSKQDNT